MTTIPNWLWQRASISPDRLAVVSGSERWTFRELDRRVDQMVRRLAGMGVAEGSRLALLMRNGANFAALVHAASKLGVVLVPLNIRLTPAELSWQLNDVSATCLVYDPPDAETAISVRKELPGLHMVATERDDQGGGIYLSELPEADYALQETIALDDVHSILYTSGTTGKPKGAMLTYGNHWWSATASALNLGLYPDDVWLACLPLFHVGGLSILLRSVIYGNTAIIHQRFNAAEVNRAIDEEDVTMISVVSAMLRQMLEQRGDVPYPPGLRCVLLGGGPAPLSLLEACAARNIPVVQTYGMTETCSQFVTLAPEDALRKIGSAGKPLMPNRLRIETDGRSAPAGEVGEIIVAGPTVTGGYVNRPDATAAAIRDGWLHTGDLGYLDDEGYLYVAARRDDLIISGGENIYPAEVEAVLLAHPAVEEAGVVGVPDPRWGQVPAAAIKLRAGYLLTADELRQYCFARLARYKVPIHIWFVESLPRNAAGKLIRRVLVDDWAHRVDSA